MYSKVRWDIRRGHLTSTGVPNAATRKLLVAGWEPVGGTGQAIVLRKKVKSR